MEFTVLRRANQSTERGDQPPELEPGVFMRPSDSAVRLTRRDGAWTRSSGPYPARELVAGFTIVEAASRHDVIEQVRWWPLFDAGAVYEIRDPANLGAVEGGAVRRPDWPRYVVFLRSDAAAEAALAPAPDDLLRLQAYEQASVNAGLLLAGVSLPATRTATRVRFANANTSLQAGPFADVRELVAGYWLVQAATLDDVIAWAGACPLPPAAEVTLEIREVCERREQREFTAEMRAAEERLRAEALEGVLREAMARRKRAL
jgi:hypothetical protein